MDNRERDRSPRSSSTETGRKNRDVSGERGRERNSGTDAEFGQSIGRAENLSEGGEMRNRDQESNVKRNTGMGGETSRRPDTEGLGSSPGRRSGQLDDEKSNVSRDDRSPGRGSNIGSSGSTSGRH